MSNGDLDVLVEAVLAGVPAGRRGLVAIDGVGGSGKTTLADELTRRIHGRSVLVLHVDDFFNTSAIRHARGRHSPEGFWLDAYDYASLVSTALEPLAPHGDGWYRRASYDRATDRTTSPSALLAPPDALVIVEGTFLHRDELHPFWDFSIYLDVELDEAERRMAARDPVAPDSVHGVMRRYTDAQRIYFAAVRPWERASVVVANREPGRPRIIESGRSSAAGQD